eukprot:scaffold83052_cov37-Tisochrysis_lutea.AAC.3
MRSTPGPPALWVPCRAVVGRRRSHLRRAELPHALPCLEPDARAHAVAPSHPSPSLRSSVGTELEPNDVVVVFGHSRLHPSGVSIGEFGRELAGLTDRGSGYQSRPMERRP